VIPRFADFARNDGVGVVDSVGDGVTPEGVSYRMGIGAGEIF